MIGHRAYYIYVSVEWQSFCSLYLVNLASLWMHIQYYIYMYNMWLSYRQTFRDFCFVALKTDRMLLTGAHLWILQYNTICHANHVIMFRSDFMNLFTLNETFQRGINIYTMPYVMYMLTICKIAYVSLAVYEEKTLFLFYLYMLCTYIVHVFNSLSLLLVKEYYVSRRGYG